MDRLCPGPVLALTLPSLSVPLVKLLGSLGPTIPEHLIFDLTLDPEGFTVCHVDVTVCLSSPWEPIKPAFQGPLTS